MISTKSAKYKLFSKRVTKGITFLNKHFKNKEWQKKINTKVLDMSVGYSCVIGQVFSDYFSGIHYLNLENTEAIQYGFQVNQKLSADRQQINYDLLQMIWVRKLAKLQAKKK